VHGSPFTVHRPRFTVHGSPSTATSVRSWDAGARRRDGYEARRGGDEPPDPSGRMERGAMRESLGMHAFVTLFTNSTHEKGETIGGIAASNRA